MKIPFLMFQNAIDIAVGTYHSLILSAEGEIYGYGGNQVRK